MLKKQLQEILFLSREFFCLKESLALGINMILLLTAILKLQKSADRRKSMLIWLLLKIKLIKFKEFAQVLMKIHYLIECLIQ